MAATPATGTRSPRIVPPIWAAANIIAGTASGLFFINWPPSLGSIAATLGARDALSGGLLLAFALFGPWAATGIAFGGMQWLLLRERVRWSAAWLLAAPFAGLGFMTTQFLVTLTTSWFLGPVATVVASMAAGWIVGALQWMLMDQPGFSANRWVGASVLGAAGAALVWYPSNWWGLNGVSTVLIGAIAGAIYAFPSTVVLMATARVGRLSAPLARSTP
jgi:hypothetical protein